MGTEWLMNPVVPVVLTLIFPVFAAVAIVFAFYIFGLPIVEHPFRTAAITTLVLSALLITIGGLTGFTLEALYGNALAVAGFGSAAAYQVRRGRHFGERAKWRASLCVACGLSVLMGVWLWLSTSTPWLPHGGIIVATSSVTLGSSVLLARRAINRDVSRLMELEAERLIKEADATKRAQAAAAEAARKEAEAAASLAAHNERVQAQQKRHAQIVALEETEEAAVRSAELRVDPQTLVKLDSVTLDQLWSQSNGIPEHRVHLAEMASRRGMDPAELMPSVRRLQAADYLRLIDRKALEGPYKKEAWDYEVALTRKGRKKVEKRHSQREVREEPVNYFYGDVYGSAGTNNNPININLGEGRVPKQLIQAIRNLQVDVPSADVEKLDQGLEVLSNQEAVVDRRRGLDKILDVAERAGKVGEPLARIVTDIIKSMT
ncbi:hypothetical protein ACUN7V_06410 [Quadrisphaera oryzae]|uniref:hypothetical protein n=1 Tax=Quadrisphaera TaxID=317661 RepID=UPI0016487437|nr:hypothetical protein [Quadrisphaera sp. RL12-1S]MBC3761558.1 hypothetical protein [Quadrisphaera sp. RL12-1S]